ncbi:MAG: chromate efflux transporter [Chelatococcus sp.]|nr:chromate efflux transporter [Chelatococcus sp. YT9]MBX3555553.1 chromate efflux transporter [Chelatococcus sp.]
MDIGQADDRTPRERVLEVFTAFLKLGCTSFGGPIAHLGYFRNEFVQRRAWLSEKDYADIVGLCQFLPGPTSSQVGFALGLLRGGGPGALLAWLGFTLPSALAMMAFAAGADRLGGPVATGVLAGLKLVAVAVVAQAVWGMALTLCPDIRRAAIAFAAGVVAALAAGSLGQIVALAAGAIAGLALCRRLGATSAGVVALPVSRQAGGTAIFLFLLLLLATPLIAHLTASHALAMFDAFYRSGALVFGGGHVVLPLLEARVVEPGWINPSEFIAGYAAAQAVPGPLFTFAAYLGMSLDVPPTGLAGAILALVAIFLPGFLLVGGIAPFWNLFRTRPHVQAALHGVNAAVVGILAAALVSPIATAAITGWASAALALAYGVLLIRYRLPPWIIVLMGAAVSATMAHLHV